MDMSQVTSDIGTPRTVSTVSTSIGTMTEEKKNVNKQLEIAIAALNKRYGEGSVVRLDDYEGKPWPAIPTGAPTLDLKTGIGGLPRGRITEIYGPESAGKSTLCMTVVAQAQAMGLTCAFIDVEHAMDLQWAELLGVTVKDLLFAQPSSGEEALEIARTLVNQGIDVIVVDSVAALTPQKELDGEIGDSHVGQLARMMSQGLRILEGPIAENETLFIFTNQLRSQIGPGMNPDITPGGKALRYAASIRIDMRKDWKDPLVKDKDGKDPLGIKVVAKIVKNKMAANLREARFDILFDKGINWIGCYVDLGVEKGILVAGGGGWYKWANGDSLGQGRMKAIETLASDVELLNKLKGLVLDGSS